MKYRMILSIIISCGIVSCTFTPSFSEQTSSGMSSLPDDESSSSATLIPLPSPSDPTAIIHPEDLEYLGAFRLPDESGGSSWEYSGRGLTYYPSGSPDEEGDEYPGSLFGVGNDLQQFVSEISIPVPVNSKDLDALNTAQTIQPFADITGGIFGETEIPRLGIQYLPPLPGQDTGKLHFVHGQHFQYFEASHGWSELILNDPRPAGPWYFDGYTNYVTSDYIFEIPENWAAFINGMPRLASGRFREGVWGGSGPTLFAYDPSNGGNFLEPKAELQNITPLLLYGIQEVGVPEILVDPNSQMLNYNEDDSWWGGAWLTSEERSAVIFVGTKALGKSWYGFANGIVWEYDCAEKTPPTCPDVPDWPYENRGYWAEDYSPQILFYNPADLIAVANGQMQTWEPQPYAVLDLTDTFINPEISLQDYKFELAGAIAYDRERGLLYIIERLADGYKSIIHVWRIN